MLLFPPRTRTVPIGTRDQYLRETRDPQIPGTRSRRSWSSPNRVSCTAWQNRPCDYGCLRIPQRNCRIRSHLIRLQDEFQNYTVSRVDADRIRILHQNRRAGCVFREEILALVTAVGMDPVTRN